MDSYKRVDYKGNLGEITISSTEVPKPTARDINPLKRGRIREPENRGPKVIPESTLEDIGKTLGGRTWPGGR